MSTGAIMGIDPGPEESAIVTFDGAHVLCAENNVDNHVVAKDVRSWHGDGQTVAIEQFVPYGKSLGQESLSTVQWIGVFWCETNYCATRIPRQEIKLHLCDTRTARDVDVRDALIHRFASGRKEAVGTKKAPGPLYGVTSHLWAALAVAVVAWDRRPPSPIIARR